MVSGEPNWKGKKVLVTGAGGFIGSHLAERLTELGAETHALVRYTSSGAWGWLGSSPRKEEMEVLRGDVTDRESVRRAVTGMEVIYHLAGLVSIPYSYQTPHAYLRTNIEGTLNVLQAALEAGVERVVLTSTSEVYGSACRVPMDETHPLRAQSPYAASKIATDKLGEAFHLSFGLPVVTLRPFNTYGPRQSARAVVPTIITQCLAGKQVRLGNLAPTRDLTYVTDTAEAFALAGQSPEAVGQVINVGSGQETSIGDLARRIADLIGAPLQLETDEERQRPEGSEVERLCAANARARKLLGWAPRLTLTEGLSRTIDWFRGHLHLYHPGAYSL